MYDISFGLSRSAYLCANLPAKNNILQARNYLLFVQKNLSYTYLLTYLPTLPYTQLCVVNRVYILLSGPTSE